MARQNSTPLRTSLSRMFPNAVLQQLAASEGVVQRQRKVEIVALFWVLILTVGCGGGRTLADLRRSYEKVTGCRLSCSAFYNRFNARFTRLLKKLMERGRDSVAKKAQGGRQLFGQIREILCIDSTVVRLHDALARSFPACRTNHTQAAAKLHTVLNVRGQGPQSIKITSERECVVGLRDDIRGGYHWYVTNLMPDLVVAEDLGKLYSARWTIELLFRERKSTYHLESIPSRKRHIVEVFLYAAVLTLLASHALLCAVRQWANLVQRRTPMKRWARLFVSAAPELLTIMLDPVTMAHYRERLLLPFFAQEAPDPNLNRPLLLDRAALSCPS